MMQHNCRVKRITPLIGATLALASVHPSIAQTQAQQDRLDRVAQFVVTAPMCGRLGMIVASDLPDRADRELHNEAASWSMPTATFEALKADSISRQSRILVTDLEAASENAKTAQQLRNVRDILMGYGRMCMAATHDPIFATLITLPPNYDLARAVNDAADAMLDSGGLASWQTPRIQARGDLMTIAGTCRSKIGPMRSDAIVKEFNQSADPRVRSYYRRSFDDGLADPSIIGDLQGCNRAIQRMRLKAR